MLLEQTFRGNNTRQDKQFLYRKSGFQSTYSIKNSWCLAPRRSRIFVLDNTNDEDIVMIFYKDFPFLSVKCDGITRSAGNDHHLSTNNTELDAP